MKPHWAYLAFGLSPHLVDLPYLLFKRLDIKPFDLSHGFKQLIRVLVHGFQDQLVVLEVFVYRLKSKSANKCEKTEQRLWMESCFLE